MPHATGNESPTPLIFISHAEEDSEIALELSRLLKERGYDTWCYEENEAAGQSYLVPAAKAIDGALAFMVLISRASLASPEVIKEVEYAHKRRKTFLPILHGVTQEEFEAASDKTWSMAIGLSRSIDIPPEGASAILSALLNSLDQIAQGQPSAPGKQTKPRKPVVPNPRPGKPSIPRWVRVGLYISLAIFLVYTVFGRNYILGKCVILEEGEEAPSSDGETAFLYGAVSFVVGDRQVTFDLRHDGYFAFPLESRFPLRGVELIFKRDDKPDKTYPVTVDFASILLNPRQTIYVRPDSTPSRSSKPSFQLASAWEGLSFPSLSRPAYATPPIPSPRVPGVSGDMTEKVLSITASSLKNSRGLTLQSNIREHADSIELSRLVPTLESEFGIVIKANEWERLTTIKDIVSYVSTKSTLTRGISQDIVRELKAIEASDRTRSKWEDLYFEPIPNKKLNNAREAAQVPNKERILALFDASLFGSASEALLFSDRGLYFCTSPTTTGPRSGFIDYEDFASRVIKRESMWEVSLGNGQYFGVPIFQFDSAEIADLLNKLARTAKARISKNRLSLMRSAAGWPASPPQQN
jgi:acyl carrier protein